MAQCHICVLIYYIGFRNALRFGLTNPVFFSKIRYMRHCSVCHNPIADQRLQALPMTRVCVQCSSETPVKGFMTWEHKTAPTFQIVNPRQHAWLQAHDRKRPAANLPMSQRTASASLPALASGPVVSTPVVDADNPLSLIPRARCGHSDRPQVGPSGKCVDCALAYYALRAKYAEPRQFATK